jgi:hypothetical protein
LVSKAIWGDHVLDNEFTCCVCVTAPSNAQDALQLSEARAANAAARQLLSSVDASLQSQTEVESLLREARDKERLMRRLMTSVLEVRQYVRSADSDHYGALGL